MTVRLSTQCQSGRKLERSGDRRSARSEGSLGLPGKRKDRFRSAIDPDLGNRLGQERRRRGQRISQGEGSHADRTRVVRQPIVMMAGLVAICWPSRRHQRLGTRAAGVEVAKGQRKVQRQRHQRKPRNKANMISNQTHQEQCCPSFSAANPMILADPSIGSIESP
jgi:hypothetical protein